MSSCTVTHSAQPATSISTIAEPKKPAPPVTSILLPLIFNSDFPLSISLSNATERTFGREQQGRDPTVAIATILAGQADDIGRQGLLHHLPHEVDNAGSSGPGRDLTGRSFRYVQVLAHMDNTTMATLGAYQFPSAASFRISLPKVKSTTARWSWSFSRSGSFRRLA